MMAKRPATTPGKGNKMGYESRLYIVEKTTLNGMEFNKTENLIYAGKIAEFNLCKMDYSGPYSRAVDKMRKTDCFIYSDDGDTPIIEDKYGECLREINIDPLIRILEKENQDYRRIKPIINLLKGFEKEKYFNLMALHYGY